MLVDLFSIDQLERHGEALALSHQLSPHPGRDKLLSRLSHNEKSLNKIYSQLASRGQDKTSLSPASIWLLDNFHLIEEQIQLARRHLPKSYSQELPQLQSMPSAGLPRVYAIIQELIAHVDGHVDEGNLRSIVAAYQRHSPLNLGELWAIPIMLRLALIENIQRIAARLSAIRRDRNLANQWADRMLLTATLDPKSIVLDLADMVRDPFVMTPTFIAEIVRRLQNQGQTLALPLVWIEQRLVEQGQTIERQVHLDSQYHAINQVSISNSIGSLRLLPAIPWKDFVEAMSLVERILRTDPAGVYSKMDFTTRDSYRHKIEKLSRQGRCSEAEVARKVIEFSSQSQTASQCLDPIGQVLVGENQAWLETTSQMKPSLRDRLERWGHRRPLFYYLGAIASLTGLLAAGTACALDFQFRILPLALALLMALAFSHLAIALVHWFATTWIKPKLLPKMDFSKSIPEEFSTLITMPTLLAKSGDVAVLINKLEVCYLANRAPFLYFSLLTDFADASSETTPEDEELLQSLRIGMRGLNEKYCREGQATFLLFHRSRQWNPKQNCWMGYERKRGKLEALNSALRAPGVSPLLVEGDSSIFLKIKYVVTMDTDTRLPRESIRKLIETMAHPLNRPVYDEALGRVTQGHAILQPRMVSSIPLAGTSWYARIFGSEFGIDPYTRAVSDVYQDLFGEGSFIGKGIYDLDVFSRCLAHRLPENRILSHDLLEGNYCRSALVSDLQWIDDFPEDYGEDMSRHHRWIRGDWQIASWLGNRVPGFKEKRSRNPITRLGKWKIFDNLRRSLIPPVLLLLIVLSWIFLKPAWAGMAIVGAIFLLPSLPAVLLAALNRPPKFPLHVHAHTVFLSLVEKFLSAFFQFCTLPYQALLNTDAIVVTLWRLWISRRQLLEWKSSANSLAKLRHGLTKHTEILSLIPLLTLVLAAFLYWQFAERFRVFYPVLVIWFCSPALVWWLSQPKSRLSPRVTEKQTRYLRIISRKTWRYFETFADQDNHFLPADNYQEAPKEVVAYRTSPTNIGLMLLSNLGAYDLGYQTASDLIHKTRKSFVSLDKMSRYRGHFLNWYDTRTLQALSPRYVSTVDSGNFAGYLRTLRMGLAELPQQGILSPGTFTGIRDTYLVLEDLLHAPLGLVSSLFLKESDFVAPMQKIKLTISEAHHRVLDLHEAFQSLQRIADQVLILRESIQSHPPGEAQWWLQALDSQISKQCEELQLFMPWLVMENKEMRTLLHGAFPELFSNRSLDQLADLHATIPVLEVRIQAWFAATAHFDAAHSQTATWLLNQIQTAGFRAKERLLEIRQCADQCLDLARQEYDFLYDTNRNLLSIGYDIDKHSRDESHYDLLASESRTASFIGIAQGQLPMEHWFSLGRLITLRKGKNILLSWGGSMFEYLMPQLIMPHYADTLLGQTHEAVIDSQIAYGRTHHIPWGISESAENLTDAALNYQYRSFGIPGLGFKRGLADDLVISPYASALALMLDPRAACANMQRLSAAGFEGRYGLYEAIDYTPGRLGAGQSHALIPSFMAHHQGMSFIALVNHFTDNVMPRRFQADPGFESALLLLQERVPKATPFHIQPLGLSRATNYLENSESSLRIFETPHTAFPEIHLLSNGRYHVMISNAGGGYSRWRDTSVTRWEEDATRDAKGTFIYVRDLSGKNKWSAAYQPSRVEAEKYEAVFSSAKAEFKRSDQGLNTHTEIAVSPEDDIEHRRVTLSNFTNQNRILELTSYAEVALIATTAEASHPAFAKLFVQTEILPGKNAILCTRRPRSASEKPPWMFHLLTSKNLESLAITFETDRLQFLGRGGSEAQPQALAKGASLSGSDGSVLDPIVSIRCRFPLDSEATLTVGFITGMAESRQAAMALIEKYQDPRLGDRVFDMALIHGKVVLQQLNASEADAQLYGVLASSIVYTHAYRRSPPSLLQKNQKGQNGLWAYSISGDLPIVILRISEASKISLAAKLIQAHAFWRLKGIQVDLVIWNEDHSGYRHVLHDLLVGLITAGSDPSIFDRAGGIFIRHPEQMSEEDRILMLTVARMVISDQNGNLRQQTDISPLRAAQIPRRLAARSERHSPQAMTFPQSGLLFYNGWGGFTPDGREYVIHIRPGELTPMPWVNVIANSHFGTVISQSGGYSWSENAHEFRLTPWYNDPVTDISGETMYLRDEVSGHFWSPTPLPAPGAGDYLNRHGFGYSVFEYATNWIKSELWIYVDILHPIKYWMLKVRNDSDRWRKMSATLFLEMVLGEHRAKSQMHLRTEIDSKTGALFITNPYNAEFPGRVVFVEANETRRSFTGDRTEFLGRNGSNENPEAMHRIKLSGRVGSGLDPAIALQVYFDLDTGEERDIVFLLGSAQNAEEARELVIRHRGRQSAHAARDQVWEYWKQTLGAVSVETPDPAVNVMANGWLMYQTMAARLWGRSGYYQSGGAYGFRDQLQDVLALVHARPQLTRQHILASAARQFREGDVQHWWHPPLGRGVRTHISDDYLWLPLVVSEYIHRIGDTGILDESLAFLESRALNAGEESLYDLPVRSEETASLYDHCKRAILHSFRFGEHGLPLMGGGDWNDGMNLVGIEGKGESVWLGFFLYHVLQRFAPVARNRGDQPFVEQCLAVALELKIKLDEQAWDGEWYLRAYFDDGKPMGSHESAEGRIDAIPQSWAVLSEAVDRDRAKQAMLSLERHLIKSEQSLILLLNPPYDQSDVDPGYIKGYVPGVRENGGQYTHAAIWAVMAFAKLGMQDKVQAYLSMINPVNHASSRKKASTYLVEPYVMAADIYGAFPHVGRGGWTWYTGSAAWMYRLVLESVLGLNLQVDRLSIQPCLPTAWPKVMVRYRFKETVYILKYRQIEAGNQVFVTVDGVLQDGNAIMLKNDAQEHSVEIVISSNRS